MIESKIFNRIASLAIVAALIFTVVLLIYAKSGSVSVPQPEYVEKLFGAGIIRIDITADEQSWTQMLENAAAEAYIPCTVTVNGVTYEQVGIRPKGNSSLSQIASGKESDRYSFRLKFDEYISGQACFGLSSFVVNNMMGDATYMKEYLSYDIMRYAGVDTTLFEYANISVNGKAWGFYLAVESYDEAFMARTYNDPGGELYSVKMSMGRGNANRNKAADVEGAGNTEQQAPGMDNMQPFDGQQDTNNRRVPPGFEGNGQQRGGGTGTPTPDRQMRSDAQAPNANTMPQGNMNQQQGNIPGRGMGGSASGGSLVYTDDDADSYPSIFDNAVTKTAAADEMRVIGALKALSEGRDIEKYFDVDQTIRYFAAHTVVVNLDSYVSGMAQNYFIYENNGQISILPWDYGLAFGGFQSGSASDVINFPINTPVSSVSVSDRPLLAMILNNEAYKAKYHECLQQILDGYFNNGKFEQTISELDAKIGNYVENDPSAFVTYEKYRASLNALAQLGKLRAQSIQGQLDGTIPSTTQGQKENPAALVSVGSMNLSSLGGMGGGGQGRGGGGGQQQETQQGQATAAAPQQGQNAAPQQGRSQGQRGQAGGMAGGGQALADMPDAPAMQQAMQILGESNNQLTDDVKAELTELGLTEQQISMLGNMSSRGQGDGQTGRGEDTANAGEDGATSSRENGNARTIQNTSTVWKTTSPVILGVLFIILLSAMVLTYRWKRNG